MRLEVTARYLLKIKPNKVFLWIIFLLLFYPVGLFSQDFKLTFRKDTPLSEALLLSSRTFKFKVAYDAQRLQSVYAREEATGNNTDEFLTDLLRGTGFTYLYKHGSYLIVEETQGSPAQTYRECQIIGSVIDYETGEQLPFATIILPDQNINVIATSNGTFSIKNIISNPVHILVSFIGYHPADTLLNWGSTNISMVVRLKQHVTNIKSVDIIRSKIEIIDYRSDVDFATTVNPSRLIDMPMLVETDIFRTLQLLPGIRYSESSSELNIRGGTSDQNLVLFDGQTLYNLSHYYGVFSSINPNVVKDIQVFKGGFDSRYGERISGIVDITGKSGNQKKPALIADINLLSVNLAIEVPITKKITIVAAGRRSFSDIYKTSFADKLFDKHNLSLKSKPQDTVIMSEPSFHFYDISTKLNYRIGDNENLSLSIYGGRDYYKNAYTSVSRSLFIANADSNAWYNYGVSLNWQKQWNTSFFSTLMIGTSGYENASRSNTKISKLMPDEQEDPFLPDSQNVFTTQNHNELKDLSFTARNTYTLNGHNQLNFGVLFRGNDIYYHKDADKIYVYDNIRQSSLISSVYTQDRISPINNLVLKPGFRLTYYNGDQHLYFEPRFAALYSFSENLSVRFATGQYNQFISQVLSQQETGYTKNFWVLSNDSVNPVLKARHFMVGVSYDKNNFFIDVEGYYKKYSGQQEYIFISQFQRNTDFGNYFPPGDSPPPSTDDQSPSAPSYFITGSGKSYGIDFFLSYRTGFYTSWLSYSLSRCLQQYDSINLGEEIPALTDQTHQVSFSNLFTLGKWSLGAIALFSTGRPYITPAEKVTDQTITRLYKRLPNYFRCDLSANYKFVIKGIQLKTGISIINLFNSQNYYDVNARTYNFENTTFSEINLVQSQKLALNLFLHINL